MQIARLFAFLAWLIPAAASAGPPHVVVSIKPLHSLAAAVMAGMGRPDLVVDGSASPHDFSLRPSQAALLQSADLIFWIGPQLETFLERPVANIGGTRSVALLDAPGLTLLDSRDVGHAPAGDTDHDHARDRRGVDPHLWLDPDNAIVLLHAMADALAGLDPASAPRYRANASAAEERVRGLAGAVADKLRPLSGGGFVVFHDAFRYFEKRFGLVAGAVVASSPEIGPGAENVAAIREAMQDGTVTCLFTEPQFNFTLADSLIEGTGARLVTADPLGADLEPGPDLYFQLLRNMADSFAACLSPR